MNVHNLLGDLPAMLVALALIIGDVTLHLAGQSSGAMPFDASIPVLVAVYIGGRVAVSSANASNGKPSAPPVSFSAQGPSQVQVGTGNTGPAPTVPVPPAQAQPASTEATDGHA